MSKTIDFSKASIMEIENGDHCVVQQVKSENIFRFPEGIVGFEHIKEYVVLLNEKVAPFMFMQSLDSSGLSFVCVETFMIKPDYSIKLPESNIATLQLSDPKDAMLLSLVTVNSDIKKFTANLMSPIILNLKNSLAIQYVPDVSIYPIRFNILSSMENIKKDNTIKVG